MRRDEPALSSNPSPSSRLRELAHVRAWVWPFALAVLMVLTSIAVAHLVTAWLVPPYLALVAWILFPSGHQRSDALKPSGQAQTPHQVAEVSSDAVRAQADDTDAPEPSDEPTTEAESLVDEAESTEQVALKNKRGRARSRKVKGSVELPTTATWVQVGPGKFVRVETASPMVAHFSQVPKSDPADGAVSPDFSSVEEGPEVYPSVPRTDAAQAADDALSSVEGTESSIAPEPVALVNPGPACAKALPSSGQEWTDGVQPVEAEVSGYHHDEPQEDNRVADNVAESQTADRDTTRAVVESGVQPADRTDDAQAGTGEELEKRGIAPEASNPEPTAGPEVERSEKAMEDTRPEQESDTLRDLPAESADQQFPAFFRESWHPRVISSWSFASISSSRRNVRNGQSGRISPGFRQRSCRSAGRFRQSCRTHLPRAPPSSQCWAQGRPPSHWGDVSSFRL